VTRILAPALATLLLALPARAQEIMLTGALEGAPAASKSSKRDERIVMPTGHLEVSGEMAFLVTQRSPYEKGLAFTDLALLRLNLRRSFADWIELYGGVRLLPKQPTATHSPLFQGVQAGAQAEFAKGFAGAVGGAVGPMFGADGVYYQLGPGLSWKPEVGRYLRFVVGVGNSWTILDYEPRTRPSFWLSEIVTHAETQAGENEASMWVGIDYAIPFAKNPDSTAADPERGFLDPQVRMNVEVGGAMSLHSNGWAVYASYTIMDRGELDRPETTLPILDGGFDQHQVVIGAEYRFDPKDDDDSSDW
jgi:hypothetical protein